TIVETAKRSGQADPVVLRRSEVNNITPPPMLAANVFRKGHRVRVEVSSSNFPAYARNLNTVRDPYTSTDFEVAHNQVLHGPDRPSRITLPVATLPARVPQTPL